MVRNSEKVIENVIEREMTQLATEIREEQVSAYILRLSELMAEGKDEEAIARQILEEMGT